MGDNGSVRERAHLTSTPEQREAAGKTWDRIFTTLCECGHRYKTREYEHCPECGRSKEVEHE